MANTGDLFNDVMANTADIFNEWARRYAANPDGFDAEILDAEGKPITDYGQRCAIFFLQLAEEQDAAKQSNKNQ